MLQAARAKSLGAAKEAVPAEVHMRLAAGEAAIYTLHVLCRAVLPLFRAGGRGSRVQSLHHLQSPYWVVTVDYRPIH